MKRKIAERLICTFLMITLIVGVVPTTAFAGYEDGTECEYCGGYRFDDWLCDCGPHCSENSDSVDCYLAHHCANCLESCDEDEKCDECEFCSECWGETGEHCSLCGKHDDDTCDNCYSCSDCQESEGFHCAYCGGCLADLPLCDQHEPEVGQENHCGDCALKCNDCGECYSGEYDEIFCDDCNQCFQCAEINGYHCNLLYCCVPGERCEECEYCNECGIDEGLHCPECAKHVDDWCERGSEGTHCMECAESVSCEQCGECTDCGGVEFCEECGYCEDCCRDNAADEGCSCGDYCVLSGVWEEHFCSDCGTCFDENEACEICGYCIECCANQSDCTEGLCIEDTDYDDHFCEQCNKCFHDVEACESCQDAGTILCEECCSAVTEEQGCEHDYCVNNWQWDEHFCSVCQKCYDDCDHEPEAHSHVYDTNGNCKICGMNKDGKPVIYKQPKSVVAAPDESYVKFTVEAFGDNLKYQWYSWNQTQGDFVALTDSQVTKGSQSKTLMITVTSGLCRSNTPVRLICKVENKSATVVSEIAEFTVAHKFGGYTNDSTHHWRKCRNCTKVENKEEHHFGIWKITKAATLEAEGLKERTCFDCGYVSSESIPKLEKKHVHAYTESYVQSNDYHWGKCACGLENKGASEKHNYGDWATTTQPTAATPGKQMRTCETCGYEDTKTITPQGHTHEFYNKEYKENHRDNGHYGSLIYNDRYVSLYEEPYGKTDKTFHYAYCVVDGCDAYEKYSHQWYAEWYDAPTSVSDGYYEIKCKDCFYVKKMVTTPAGKYRIETKGGSANVQTAKPGQKVKLTPYSKYPVGQYFDPKYSSISVGYTWGGGASGTWGWNVDVEYHAPDAEDTREYWYFTMPTIPADKLSGDIETDYWNVYVEVEFEIYDCCSDENPPEDRICEWVNKVEANCGKPGYSGDFQCKYCGYVKIRGEVTPVTGEPHGTLIQEPDFEGNCTKSGYTGGKTCSVCNQLVEPRVSTGKKHNPVRVAGTYIPSTCTSIGQSQQFNCADCGKVLKKSKPIAKTSHDWGFVKGTATCTSSGTREHWKCTTCGLYSLDGGTTSTRNSAKLKTSALGHDFKWIIDQPATTSSDGRKHQYCERCKVENPAVEIYKIGSTNLSKSTYTYDGISKFPDVIVRDLAGNLISSDYYTVKKPLRSVNVGTYTYTVTFNGEYSGSTDLFYKINPASIEKKTITLSYTSTTYNGSAKTPDVTVEGLTKDTDYTVTYKNNINAGTATVIITGKGNYTGTIEKKFTINTAQMSGLNVTGKTATYNGNPHTITLTGAPEGAEIVYKTSIINAYNYPKPTRTDAGTTTVYYKVTHPNYNTVEGKVDIIINKATMSDVKVSGVNKTYDGNSYSITIKNTPDNSKIYYKTSSNGVYLWNKPTRTDAGTTTVYYKIENANYKTKEGSAKIVINPASLSSVKLSKTDYVYDGKAKKPSVTVKNKFGTVLKKNTHYTVSYKNNLKVGKASVTIKGKGNYTGGIRKTFTINPVETKITSLKKGSKSFTVKWSKKTTQTTGYQIYYTTSKTRKNGKTVTISKNTTTKKTINKLKSKKKYYVWVRTYKSVNGTKYYSEWSSRKYVVTK